VPEVAVMVIINETVAGTVKVTLEPQPVTRPMPATLTASSSSSRMLRRFLKPKQHSATASVVTGKNGLGPEPPGQSHLKTA